jgi:BASS family bile acid:Na+ symporter
MTAFSAAYWLSCLFDTDEAERVSLMYGLGMNNNGTGLVLASLALASYPRVMIPIILYNIVQHLVAGAVHQLMSREPKARAVVLGST